VVGLLGGDDGGVGRKHEMDTRVGHQVGLELGDVDVEGAIETKGSGQGGDDLGQQAVQVGVPVFWGRQKFWKQKNAKKNVREKLLNGIRGALDVEVATACFWGSTKHF